MPQSCKLPEPVSIRAASHKPRSLLRSTVTLSLGSATAQGITLVATPILTRIYSPEDFGLLSIYVACTSVLATIACGRFELAILLPESDQDAACVTLLCLILNLVFCTIIALAAFLIPFSEIAIANSLDKIPLYLISLGTFALCSINILTYWSNRFYRYRRMAASKAVGSLATNATQTSIGIAAPQLGLITGVIAGQIVSVAILATASLNKFYKVITLRGLIKNAREYKDYPLLSTWGALFDNAALQMPVFFVSKLHGEYATGILGFTMRTLSLPTALLSPAISQVVHKKIVDSERGAPESNRPFILKTFSILFCSTLPFIVATYLFGEQLFVFAFGKQWAEAGQIAWILSIAIAVRFSISPLSSVLALKRNLKTGAAWQTLYLLTVTTTLTLSSTKTFTTLLYIFTVHESILYSIYLWLIIRGTKTTTNKKCAE
mgnify:CR=1 FL=1